jgi:hypothetical protein
MLGNLYIAILISTSKNALSFLLLFMSSLQQNWRKERIGSAWKQGGEREWAGGRNDPNNVCTYEYMSKEKM